MKTPPIPPLTFRSCRRYELRASYGKNDTVFMALVASDERKWRGQHDLIERADAQISDTAGDIGDPWRTVGLLTTMARNGRICAEECLAGEEFHEQFIIAGHQPLRAADMGRIGGAVGATPIHHGSVAAQHAVNEALERLGGRSSLGGACAWYVLGLEHSLTTWAGAERTRGRMISTQNATGILIGGLGVLRRHFGY